MSNALAISGVSSVLEYLLGTVYSTAGLSVTVSAKAPDLVQADTTSNPDALLVNLFLHQVTFNSGWRNIGQPSVDANGATRLTNPPLALDLHYLLTAYGSKDCEAEALLGYAIQMMHETPVVARSEFVAGLKILPITNPLAGLLASSGLANQIELLKITPATLGREELAWLWTALKADYRPTFPFQVSVVLIESPSPAVSTLPVLSRNLSAQSGLPLLFAIQPPPGQPPYLPVNPALGDLVTISGQSLTGANLVMLTNQRLGITYRLPIPPNGPGTSISFVVPVDPVNLPAGVYSLSILFTDALGNVLNTTNVIPIAIAPTILLAPAPTVTPNGTGLLVTINCTPNVLPTQSVSLGLGSSMVPLQSSSAPNVLSFQFPALAPGAYLARMRVDGVESAIAVNWNAQPPTFTNPMVTVP